MKHICFSLLLAMGLAGSLAAQQEISLWQAPELWHANALNPAFVPASHRLMIGLPGLGIDAAHSGDIRFNDLIRRDGDQRILDLGRLLDRLEPQNDLTAAQRVETLTFGWRQGDWVWHAGHTVRLDARLTYPKNIAELLWRGNAPFIGQTLEVAPALNAAAWQEWSIGSTRTFARGSIGARVKWLSGIASLATSTERRSASVFTDPDIYQLSLTTNYGFHSAATIADIDTAGLGFQVVRDALAEKLFSGNNGVAFDLGATWKLGSRVQISAAALDLGGRINWKADAGARYFESQGTYRYEGVKFPGADIIDGTAKLDFETQLDTLNDIFNFSNKPQDFKTTVPARFYVGGTFDISQKWQAGVTVFHQNGQTADATAVGVTARWSPVKWATLGAQYVVNDRSADNAGFQLILRPGPVQFYVMSDNLVSSARFYDASQINFRVGMSVLLLKNDRRDDDYPSFK